MRTLTERRQVNKWLARGASDYAIAGITGVPRGTVQQWRRHPDRGPRGPGHPKPWRPPDPATYAYLLGLYLGDGYLNPKGSPLMIALDARYPGIVNLAEAAIQQTMPGIATHRYLPKDNLVRVVASSVAWREAFPQHGAGRKHLRPIELEPWQREITSAFPRELLRGLIHSDGCRTMNRFKTKLPSGRVAAYEYPRSADAQQLTVLAEDPPDVLAQVGEEVWTQSNPRNISVSHRKSVALMDEFIGPKW